MPDKVLAHTDQRSAQACIAVFIFRTSVSSRTGRQVDAAGVDGQLSAVRAKAVSEP